MIECINRYFELYMTNFQFLVRPLQVTENVRKNIKVILYKFRFKIKFRLPQKGVVWRIKPSRKTVPQELSDTDVPKFVFWKFSRNLIQCCQNLWNSRKSCIGRKILPIKIIKCFCYIALARSDNAFTCINWKQSCCIKYKFWWPNKWSYRKARKNFMMNQDVTLFIVM